MKYVFIIWINLLFGLAHLFSQDISGLWVHDGYGVKINTNPIYAIMYLVADNPNEIVGYTYDIQYGSSCSFQLKGVYNTEENQLKVVNTKKIRKHFLHGRGKYKLAYEVIDGEEFLIGKVRQKGVHGLALSFGGLLNVPLKYRRIHKDSLDNVIGYENIKPLIDSLKLKNSNAKIANLYEVEIEAISKIEDNEETIALNEQKNNRIDELLSTHTIKSRKLTIEIFDENLEDGDRISIYVNDILFKFNIEVKKKPQYFELILPQSEKEFNITFVANNVGKVPPNTATLKYKIDDIVFQENLSTDEKKNKFLKIIVDEPTF